MAKVSRSAKREARVKELQAEYRKLAKTANTRMTKLEKLSKNPEYKAVLGYSYKNAAHDLKALGTETGRFPQDIAKMSAKETNIKKLQQYITAAKNFINAPSSTKTGVDRLYGSRAKTLNRKYGTDMTADDMRDFFENSLWEKLSNRLGSQTAMVTMAKIQKNAGQIKQEVARARSKHQRIEIDSLKDVDGLDVDAMLKTEDRKVVENLAKIYSSRRE